MACAHNATPENLGKEPPTDAQIEATAEVVAVLARVLNIPITQLRIMTHAEAAAIDGYALGSGSGQSKWDLSFLKQGDEPGSGGKKLRDMAIHYQKSGKIDWLFK
jgi:hypothetical protein